MNTVIWFYFCKEEKIYSLIDDMVNERIDVGLYSWVKFLLVLKNKPDRATHRAVQAILEKYHEKIPKFFSDLMRQILLQKVNNTDDIVGKRV